MTDRHRPAYHFLAPANWMNDPNGLIQWQGVYHLFYQHNPNAARWGDIHWGHASSRDLVHWTHHPFAMAPIPGGLDDNGVWSGCAVNHDGRPTFVYTAHDGRRETVCLAESSDGLMTWEKYSGNPVIAGPPEGLDTLGFRDPYVWREDGKWKLVIGSGLRGVGGAIFLYCSDDMLHWDYLGQMVTGDLAAQEPLWTGKMWECPNFFRLGEEYMLVVSAMDTQPDAALYTVYFQGRFADGKFTPRKTALLDGGEYYFYAPQAFLDEQGRRIAFGWAREARSENASLEAGWAGVMTLPRLFEAGPDGALVQRPVPEVELLRGEARRWNDIRLPDSTQAVTIEGLSGDTMELEAAFLPETGRWTEEAEIGLFVRCSPGNEECTEIRVRANEGSLVVNTLRSSTSSDVATGHYEMPLEVSAGEPVRLRVFLDRSMLEVFAGDRAAITARIYPTREDSTGVALFARGCPVKASLTAWDLTP